MIWIASYKDGRKLRQYDVGKNMNSSELDKDLLDTFRITETSGDTAIQFSSDSGILRFSNLDYTKIMKLEGGEKLTLEWDSERESFIFDRKSLEFFNEIALKDERDYFYIEFDQTGVFYINGQQFYMGYIIDGMEFPFINQPPYNDFKYIITSNDDFLMNNKGVPSKRMNYVTSYSLTLNKTHKFDGLEFDVSYTLTYDVIKSWVDLNALITSKQVVNGNMFMKLGSERTANPVDFLKNERKQFRRTLMLL